MPERFEELKAKGWKNLTADERTEYSLLKPKEAIGDQEQGIEEQPPEDGLTSEEKHKLSELSTKIQLTEEEKKEKAALRRKKSDFRMGQIIGKMKKGEVEIGELDKELVWILYIIARCSAPILFKYLSAAQVSEEDLKLMHAKINLLNEKLNS